MKVLALNKYFYLRGGTERYMFDVADVLMHRGHEVIPFAMRDTKNDPSPWSKYFSAHRETEKVRLSFAGVKTALNSMYSFEAKRKVTELIRASQPTVAHIHNVYHQLSSSVLDALQNARVPAVMTIHDYRLISPNYTLFHSGRICERGLRNAFSVVPHKCLKNSYAASFVAACETALTRSRHTYEKTISRFIVPSQATYDVFARAGWNMKRFVVIPHFLDARRYEAAFAPGNDVVYVGRLSPEKGVDTYIEAARRLPGVKFRIIGAGPDEARLRFLSQDLPNVEFVGWLAEGALHHAIASAALVIVPSVWYEVFGYAALEAMALGKPVIASNIGALPEIVRDGETGKLFTPNDSAGLADAIRTLMSSRATLERMGRAARARVEQHYSPDLHFGRLMEAYSDALADHSLWKRN